MFAQKSEVSTTKPKGKKLNGTFIIFGLLIMLALVFLGAVIIREVRWNSYLSKIEPRDDLSVITKDLKNYYQRFNNFPVGLQPTNQNQSWQWASQAIDSPNAGISTTGPKTISRFQHKQYQYLYSKINNQVAIIWAVPMLGTQETGSTLNDLTGQTDTLLKLQAKWRFEKPTWFVVLAGENIRAWRGQIGIQPQATFGLERNLEPTPDWLSEQKLFAYFGERWISPAAKPFTNK